MRGYYLDVSCPRCGGSMSHVVASKVNAATSCSAVARCGDCAGEWQVLVALRPVFLPAALRRRVKRAERREGTAA